MGYERNIHNYFGEERAGRRPFRLPRPPLTQKIAKRPNFLNFNNYSLKFWLLIEDGTTLSLIEQNLMKQKSRLAKSF